MRTLVALLVVAAAATIAIAQENQEKTQRLVLNVDGVECANCAKVLTATFGETDVKLVGALKPNKEGPSAVIAVCPAACDLGAVAAKVNAAETPHREERPPGLFLMLFAEPGTATQSELQTALRGVEGVDAAASKIDVKTGQINVKISGKEKVTVSQIVEALKAGGIDAQLARARGDSEDRK